MNNNASDELTNSKWTDNETYESTSSKWINSISLNYSATSKWSFSTLSEENQIYNHTKEENLTNEEHIILSLEQQEIKLTKPECSLVNDTNAEIDRELELCNWCDKEFSKQDLQLHITRHTKDFICRTCGKEYKSYGALLTHVGSHTGERNHLCDFCGKKFQIRATLLEHINIHTGSKPYTCEICGKSFNNHGTIRRHMILHNDLYYQCDICGKRFKRKDYLTEHLKIHNGEPTRKHKEPTRKYKETRNMCSVCGKIFKRSYHLKVHMRIHTGEKPFQCDYCPNRYYTNPDKTKHMKNIHKEQYDTCNN